MLEAKAKQEPNVREGKVKEGKVREKGEEKEQAADAAPTSAEFSLGDEAKPTKSDEPTDSDWLVGLCSDPAYSGLDVEREHAKCIRWCKEHGKQPTRRRFVNWLNRCDKPMACEVNGRSDALATRNGYTY